jgi:hypothetical protein
VACSDYIDQAGERNEALDPQLDLSEQSVQEFGLQITINTSSQNLSRTGSWGLPLCRSPTGSTAGFEWNGNHDADSDFGSNDRPSLNSSRSECPFASFFFCTNRQ